MFCEDEQESPCSLTRQAIVCSLAWAPSLNQSVKSGQVFQQPGILGVLQGMGSKSLFFMHLLETHHGFQIVVLLFCLHFGIVEGDGIRSLRQHSLL